MLEENKHHWLRVIAAIVITFIVAFLAFYLALGMTINKMTDPMYNAKRMERMMRAQEKSFERIENKMAENPFEPTMRPMLVNLVKENNEYKVIVDLRPLDGNENGVNVEVDGNELTVTGELEKKVHGSEKITGFAQSYYVEEKLDSSKITKEKKGDKYIITIPFKG